ncbi:hypothetical protein TWF694_005503 [Orbilia ellipsospora]|uniref:Apple domain-containing protein n=1 Tax=Orbilia ellipsospora TaxID=2528407 RepID=A0AAV9WVE5_9PEZI
MKVSIVAASISLLASVQSIPTPSSVNGAISKRLNELGNSGVKVAFEITVANFNAAFNRVSKRGVASDSFVKVFDNAVGATQSAGCLGITALSTYDVDACASKCLANSNCVFFNLYDDVQSNGKIHKCALYSEASTMARATYYGGGYKTRATSAISRSTGYKKKSLQPTVPRFQSLCYGSAAIDAPPGSTTYMGVFFTFTSASACAAACVATTAYNEEHAAVGHTYQPCNFFQFYDVYRDGVLFQKACTFYSIPYGAKYATNHGAPRDGHTYTIGESCGYTANTLVGVNGLATKKAS